MSPQPLTPQQQRVLAGGVVSCLIEMDPSWLTSIRERLARGESYDEWRASFQRLIDLVPALAEIVAKPDGEEFLRTLWQISRERAGASA